MTMKRGENPGSIYEIFEEVPHCMFNSINSCHKLAIVAFTETQEEQRKEEEILQRRGSLLEA